jgi:hypothetical protein
MKKILLDSGAYSTWRRGCPIDPFTYIDFIRTNLPYISMYIALDVIAGANGRRENNPEAIEATARASDRNLQVMLDAGLTPLPVFQGSTRSHGTSAPLGGWSRVKSN